MQHKFLDDDLGEARVAQFLLFLFVLDLENDVLPEKLSVVNPCLVV